MEQVGPLPGHLNYLMKHKTWLLIAKYPWGQGRVPSHVGQEERNALVERVVVPASLGAERRGAEVQAGAPRRCAEDRNQRTFRSAEL